MEVLGTEGVNWWWHTFPELNCSKSVSDVDLMPHTYFGLTWCRDNHNAAFPIGNNPCPPVAKTPQVRLLRTRGGKQQFVCGDIMARSVKA